MLDGLLGRGFSSKCKSLIKPTRTRIDVLRRRLEATQRFLKSNLAQLLANGLDINAFGRTEEFLAGQNLLSCYDFIEQSCEYILKQLSLMQKQRECPEECREAVGSLMFAAARFSDFPELRDLRDTFQERYGSCLEHFVNQEFVEKLSARPPKMEKKIQLLEEIALEFSINWDSRGFEQRMSNPSAFAQEQPKKYGPVNDHEDKYKLPNGTGMKDKLSSHSSKDRRELAGQKDKVHNAREDNQSKRNGFDQQIFGREELIGKNQKPQLGSERTTPRRDNRGIPLGGRREFAHDKNDSSLTNREDGDPKRGRPGSSFRGKKPDFVDNGYEVHINKVNIVHQREHRGSVFDTKPENAARVVGTPSRHDGTSTAGHNVYGKPNAATSTRKIQDEEPDGSKPFTSNTLPPPYLKSRDKLVPPPYTKPRDRKYGVNAEAKTSSSDYNLIPMGPSTSKRDNAVGRSENLHERSDYLNSEDHIAGTAGLSHHGHEKDSTHWDNIPLPKPRSMRRKHSKSSSSRDDHEGNPEDAGVVKRKSSSRRRDDSRRGLQILFDDDHRRTDEEERVIDKLLLHYSSKPSSYEPEKVTRKSKAHQVLHQTATEVASPPTRSVSLPREQTAPAEAVKVYARANSFHPDKPAKHVHPKLPDYDDLAARFAALKGR